MMAVIVWFVFGFFLLVGWLSGDLIVRAFMFLVFWLIFGTLGWGTLSNYLGRPPDDWRCVFLGFIIGGNIAFVVSSIPLFFRRRREAKEERARTAYWAAQGRVEPVKAEPRLYLR